MADLPELVRAWRTDAEALKRHGETRLAAALETCAAAVEASDVWALTEWLPEGRAVTRAGHERRFFVRRRQEWAARGLARETKTGWEYRACVVPQAARVDDTTDDRVARALEGWAA